MSTIYRKEIKYIITIAEYLRIKPWLEQIMSIDSNGKDGGYIIRTLYFDSLNDKDLYDNLDGLRRKRKIRLRAYLPNYEKAKLECKSKNGSDGIKYTVLLNKQEIEEMINGNYSCLTKKDDEKARLIYQRMISGAYKPKTIIQYHRVAYIYPVSNTRVTFDSKIRGTVTGNGFTKGYPGFIPLLPDSHGVLEIKYNDFPPYPIVELMKNLDSLPQANSKYTLARNII